MGLDIHFVVTSLPKGSAEHVYEVLYCARGQAENLIKMQKSQARLRSHLLPITARQPVRLVLHTAAYRLMLMLRDAVPATHHLRKASSPRSSSASSSSARVCEALSCIRFQDELTDIINSKVAEGVSDLYLAQLLMVAAGGQLLRRTCAGRDEARAMFVTIGNHVARRSAPVA